MISVRRSALCIAFLALAAGACGGQEEEDDGDFVIDDTESALSGVESGADDEAADDHCRDGDRDGHKHHRRHWFKILDLLDGTKDKSIVIAALPAGLPERLLTRLHRIDKNDDGIVTKKEAKRALRRHRGDRDQNEQNEQNDD